MRGILGVRRGESAGLRGLAEAEEVMRGETAGMRVGEETMEA